MNAAWRRRLPALAAAFLFAAANLAFFVVYGSGAHTRRDALEARRTALAHTVAEAEAEAARLTAQKERLSGVSEAMEEFYGHRIGSQRETLAAVVDDLHGALSQAGVATKPTWSSSPSSKAMRRQAGSAGLPRPFGPGVASSSNSTGMPSSIGKRDRHTVQTSDSVRFCTSRRSGA